MRKILILLSLTCAPAFCQDDNANFQFNPQWFPKMQILKPLPVLKMPVVRTENICSIPLLSAKAADKPVNMPEPRKLPGAQGLPDHMAVKPPAPACPAR